MLVFASALTVLAQPRTAATASDVMLASFEKVWTTVRDRHWEPEKLEKLPGGRSWQQLHDDYLAKLKSAPAQGRALLNQMLGELGQSHYAVMSGESAGDLTTVSMGDGVTGIRAALVGDAVLVMRVDSGSAAAKIGVAPGWEITRIRDFDVRRAVTAARRQSLKQPELIVNAVVSSRLMGLPGSAVSVEFADGASRPVKKEIPLGEAKGNRVRFGLMPPTLVEFESRRPAPDVGYVRFNFFLDPPGLMAKFEDAVKSCEGCRGFVIDLRGNPGGLAILAATMSGFFVDRPDVKLGNLYQRNLNLKLSVNPRLGGFPGPLAILVDGASASTSEIMAGGLQDLKRARIFGSRTAGAALPSMIERLPNGDLFQYAMANYISEGGRPLEGAGVTPDEPVTISRGELLAGKDPVLERALSWVHAQKP
jgi:carboxyl-terminal processing protease